MTFGSEGPRVCAISDGEHHLRHREEDVRDAHEEIADPAVIVPGDQADGHPDEQRGPDRDDPDEDRDPRPEQEAAVDVAAHPVGPEPRLAAGRLEPLGRMQLEHVVRVRGQQRRPSAASTSARINTNPSRAERSRANRSSTNHAELTRRLHPPLRRGGSASEASRGGVRALTSPPTPAPPRRGEG